MHFWIFFCLLSLKNWLNYNVLFFVCTKSERKKRMLKFDGAPISYSTFCQNKYWKCQDSQIFAYKGCAYPINVDTYRSLLWFLAYVLSIYHAFGSFAYFFIPHHNYKYTKILCEKHSEK